MPRITTGREDNDFRDKVINNYILELALDWISSNMEPQDVFDEKQLTEWAESEGFSKD